MDRGLNSSSTTDDIRPFHDSSSTSKSENVIHKLKSTWLVLKPSSLNPSLNSLKFPLNSSEEYEIGSTSDNDLVLPSVSVESMPDVIIRVERNKQIVVENDSSAESGSKFKINGVRLGLNRKFTIAISEKRVKARFKFGSNKYLLSRCAAPSQQFYGKLKNLTTCASCTNLWNGPVPLPCGHIVCVNCADMLNRKAIVKAESLLEVSQEEFLYEMARIVCPKCKKKMMINQIAEITDQTILTALESDFKNKFLSYPAPTCAECKNVRCLALKCDYWNCESCMCYLCPLCAFDGHRNHLLLFGYNEMHETYRNYERGKHKVMLWHYDKMKRKEVTLFSKYRESLYILDACAKSVHDCENKIDKLTATAKLLYAKLENSGLGDSSAFEDCKLFCAIIETLQNPLESLTNELLKKSHILRQYQSRMPVPTIEYIALMQNYNDLE